MTPAEHARLVDKQDFEAECVAVRERAFAYAAQCRQREAARVSKWFALPIPEHNAPMTRAQKRRIEEASKPIDVAVVKPIKAAPQKASKPAPRRRTPATVRAVSATRVRHVRRYTHNGESKTLTEWAKIAGVSLSALSMRLHSGMDFDRAFAPNLERKAKLHTIDGVSKSLPQWAAHIGLDYYALMSRLRRGRTLAEALAMPTGRHPGVSSNLAENLGTDAGSFSQAEPNITFSGNPE